MKRLLSCIILLSLSLSTLSGCGTSSTEENPTPKPSTSELAKEAEAGIVQPLEIPAEQAKLMNFFSDEQYFFTLHYRRDTKLIAYYLWIKDNNSEWQRELFQAREITKNEKGNQTDDLGLRINDNSLDFVAHGLWSIKSPDLPPAFMKNDKVTHYVLNQKTPLKFDQETTLFATYGNHNKTPEQPPTPDFKTYQCQNGYAITVTLYQSTKEYYRDNQNYEIMKLS